jgi:hypothetical protein
MVVKTDVVHDMRHRFDQVSELTKVYHLGLQRMIKRFHIRIVPAAALAAFTDQQVMFIEHSFQRFVRELSASIRMKDRTFARLMRLHQPGDAMTPTAFALESCGYDTSKLIREQE